MFNNFHFFRYFEPGKSIFNPKGYFRHSEIFPENHKNLFFSGDRHTDIM